MTALLAVTSGDLACQFGIGATGVKPSVLPFIHCDRMNSPFSILGVWQSWHFATCSTRYFPRAAFASCPGALCAQQDAASKPATQSVFIF